MDLSFSSGLTTELNVTQFLTTFLAAVSTFAPEITDLNRKPIDRPQSDILSSYDFIIVGAGSAGCVLANRLSKNPDWNVLLIEDGGQETAISQTPWLVGYTFNTDLDWNYTTTQQGKACLAFGGRCAYTRGRVMGGSSSINSMMYVRGNPQDFDEWESEGNPGWGYKDVLPYFKKAEKVNIPDLRNSPYHGKNGPISTQYPKFITPLASAIIKAGNEIGIKLGDYNGDNQNRVSKVQSTINDYLRQSTSKGYLNPIRNRKNLHIAMRSRVTQILIDFTNKVAVGVKYVRNGKTYEVKARKEVILSAGAVNTPQILMLSGIGPADQLKKLNIPVNADLPVGKYLRDHAYVYLHFSIDKNITINSNEVRTKKTIIDFAKNKKGPLTTTALDAVMYFNEATNENTPPDVNLLFVGTATEEEPGVPLITAIALDLHPESVGSITISSTNPNDQPVIDPNYFSDPRDEEKLISGLHRLMALFETDAMKPYSPKLFTKNTPNCVDLINKSNMKPFFRCHIQQYASTQYHPVSTARMGPNPKTSVVNSELLVHGFKNLRVVDASIMPRLTRGNTNAPTIMIGEKGSDIIKKCYSSHNHQYHHHHNHNDHSHYHHSHY